MTFAEVFIERPVATTLATLAIALAGILAYFHLPVAPLPQVDFPTISVQANLPGASPETMAATVATPLERTLGRIPGVTEMTSTSSQGSTRVTLQFDLSRDIDGAANDVQAGINAARGLLPSGLPSNPSYRKANPADAPIMILALTSDVYSPGQLYDVASTILAPKISQLSGIGQVFVGGSSTPAVRVSLDLPKLEQTGLSLEDVRTAITRENANRPKGSLEDGERRWQITANDQLSKAKDYMPLIVSYHDGSALRLGDLGKVEDSVQDTMTYGTSNGVTSVSLVLFRQSGANILETVDQVKEMLPKLTASVPEAMNLNLVMERTVSIRGSLQEVKHALMLSVALVIGVVWVFLRRFKAALVPGAAVPVSLIGTFAIMWACGYSIDNLSLMALTIATGFVVDDAVVVLENISRHVEAGMPAREAARRGTREVTSTVVSMSISLVAVFIPILFMGGIVGRLFREFAVVLSASIGVSLLVSLTTTPTMCARLLAHHQGERSPRGVSRKIGGLFTALQRGYVRTLRSALDHRWITLMLLLGTVALTAKLYVIVPKGIFPQQDTGQLRGSINGDQGVSFQAMREKVAAIAEIVRQDPAVAAVNASTGGGGDARNSGNVFISLKRKPERTETPDQIIARLRKATSHIPGATLYLSPTQDIRVGGRPSASAYQYTLQAGDLAELRAWEPKVRQALQKIPLLSDVNSDFQDKGGLTRLTIDREAASRLGVTMDAIDSTLNSAFGQRQISVIHGELNQYRVVLGADEPQQQDPGALQLIRVKSATGELVPLTAFAKWDGAPAPLTVNHQGSFAAITFSFNVQPGVAFGDANDAVRDAMSEIGLPNTIQRAFTGSAGAFQASLDNQPWLILAALLVIYLTLGILYESFLHPLTILSTLPSAGVGALLALMLCRMPFDIMGFIGIFLLIGIVKKNAIMMIDFALDAERNRNLGPKEAILQACEMRLRPILMTTLAAMLGALPLAIGFGEGSELRRPLGVAIVGGLFFSQILTLYTTPVVYLFLDRLRHRFVKPRLAPGIAPAWSSQGSGASGQ